MFGIFRNKNRVELDDPVFGTIEFEQSHGVNMWCHLPSDDGDHAIIVEASSSGPSKAQRDFYGALRRDIIALEGACKDFILRQSAPPSHLSDMRIYSIEIGGESELAKGKFVVELSDDDAIEIHRVEFNDRIPKHYGVDD